jgi:BA14K-like protein
MEPKMISLKVLSTAAILALVLPMAAPSVSFAAPPGKGGPAGVRGAGAPRGGGAPGPRFSGAPGQRFSGGGGNYRRGGGGFIPGAVAGAVIGGAFASQGYGYGPGYYDPGYAADPSYYDDGSGYMAVAPQGGDDSVAYCMQTYRSYDPQSGTYMGYDGYRHPCP